HLDGWRKSSAGATATAATGSLARPADRAVAGATGSAAPQSTHGTCGRRRAKPTATRASHSRCVRIIHVPFARDGVGTQTKGTGIVVAHMSAAEKGTVYLVGAGPGDPELLTLRAAALLRSADLVLHDDLVPEAVIAMAGKHALVMSVGKRCGAKHVHQSEIHSLMIEAAHQQLSVVR